MLILTRGLHERILIGDDITITVVALLGHKVRLGIDAPIEVAVDRTEIRQRKVAEMEGRRPGRLGE